MRHLLLAAALLAACHGNDSATGTTGSATPKTTPSMVPTTDSGSAAAVTPPPAGSDVVAKTDPTPAPPPTPPTTPPVAPPPAALEGHDFTPEGKALLAVGACGDIPPPASFPQKILDAHCEIIKKAQADYLEQWVKPARAFFATHVPPDAPKKVVYPFAGGDLSTALTVFPDADEITTMSLEPAGDPRTLTALKGRDLDRALAKIEYELKFLYRVNFSNTLNMIDAMRSGTLPTNLVFSLSALKIHGYEVVSLRYFKLNEDGSPHYLDDADIAKAPEPEKGKAETRNRIFANEEIQFRKAGGRIQVYRHMQQNLDNEHLKTDPRVLKYLQAKGPISAMTKAASYLLSWESFSNMRDYLLANVVWMVSDATGVAPKWGRPAGFEYETYGGFVGPHIPAGNGIAKDWRTEFSTEPHRDLGFRFGYYDKKSVNHLVIMRKKK
jgi:hypothetical protein